MASLFFPCETTVSALLVKWVYMPNLATAMQPSLTAFWKQQGPTIKIYVLVENIRFGMLTTVQTMAVQFLFFL